MDDEASGCVTSALMGEKTSLVSRCDCAWRGTDADSSTSPALRNMQQSRVSRHEMNSFRKPWEKCPGCHINTTRTSLLLILRPSLSRSFDGSIQTINKVGWRLLMWSLVHSTWWGGGVLPVSWWGFIDDDGQPRRRDCACRGTDAGFVHFSCLMKYVEIKSKGWGWYEWIQ